MTGPFRLPGEPPVFTPAATATAAPAPVPAPAAAAASSTAAALDLTSSNDNYSQDSDVEVVGGKTPFIFLTGDIMCIMQDRLNANATSGNVNSTSAETLKRISEAVVGKREYLLELTGGLDASMEIPESGGMTIRGLLSKSIRDTFATKTTKSKVCEFMVNVWAVLQVVITNVSIGRDIRHDLQQYIDLLTRIEAVARREISEADEQDKTAKSLKLPGQAMERMYLTDRGSKPPILFSACAKCGHSLLDEPPFNKDYARANKVVVDKWEEDNHLIEVYLLRGSRIPLLTRREPP